MLAARTVIYDRELATPPDDICIITVSRGICSSRFVCLRRDMWALAITNSEIVFRFLILYTAGVTIVYEQPYPVLHMSADVLQI